jgi:hypothetical protein
MMTTTIFIVGPLYEMGPFLVAMLERKAHVCVFDTAAEMEAALQEDVLPPIVIMSVLGVPADDMHLLNLLEEYWTGRQVSLILISPFPLERSIAPWFYAPYGGDQLVQPVEAQDILDVVEELMRMKTYRQGGAD